MLALFTGHTSGLVHGNVLDKTAIAPLAALPTRKLIVMSDNFKLCDLCPSLSVPLRAQEVHARWRCLLQVATVLLQQLLGFIRVIPFPTFSVVWILGVGQWSEWRHLFLFWFKGRGLLLLFLFLCFFWTFHWRCDLSSYGTAFLTRIVHTFHLWCSLSCRQSLINMSDIL